jgi:hypothetical protein
MRRDQNEADSIKHLYCLSHGGMNVRHDRRLSHREANPNPSMITMILLLTPLWF